MGSKTSKEAKNQQQQQKQTAADGEETKTRNNDNDDDDDSEDHDFEIVPSTKDDGAAVLPLAVTNNNNNDDNNDSDTNGLWIGMDLGTSNCASAIWDSTRASPKMIRFQHLARPQQPNRGKPGRIVPSAVQIHLDVVATKKKDSKSNSSRVVVSSDLCKDIEKWNPNWNLRHGTCLSATVGYHALQQLQQQPSTTTTLEEPARVITSMKRILGVCDTTNLDDLETEFRASLPFTIQENDQGQWIIPYRVISSGDEDDETMIYLRPVHVAAMILQAMKHQAELYLARAMVKKKMKVPGGNNNSKLPIISNVVIGVPAYYGQAQKTIVMEAARLAGFQGHVSTLTEATAAAMAYGLFVGQPKLQQHDKVGGAASSPQRAILVLDMGGGTTDITIATMNSNDNDNDDDKDRPDEQFKVVLTDGDSRLGGEDMDLALFQLVLLKATSSLSLSSLNISLTRQERQHLLQACQQAKEDLCGNVDHGDPPKDATTIALPKSFAPVTSISMTRDEFHQAIQPLLDRTANVVEQVLQRFADKQEMSANNTTKKKERLIHEVILIGGATRVPALRHMLKERFFAHLDLCTSVNAMCAVAQGAAIQAAIVSQQVPLHELKSAMMLDTMPHAMGVLLPANSSSSGGHNDHDTAFVEILPRDSPLPAKGHATFYVADLNQRGVTISAVEWIAQSNKESTTQQYQPVVEFSFLLHRLTDAQKQAIRNDAERPGLRPIDVGMTLGTDGAFQVSIFDSNDPDHVRNKELYEKSKQMGATELGVLEYIQAAADTKSQGITSEETRLIFVLSCLFVFYSILKLCIRTDDMMIAEEGLVHVV